MFNRIELELQKYQELDKTTYYNELCDVLFNRVQSLLIINRIEEAINLGERYKKISTESDNLYLILQQKFIAILIGMYEDFPTNSIKMTLFLETLDLENSSEFNFYKIILSIHKEKAKNYYTRYHKKPNSSD